MVYQKITKDLNIDPKSHYISLNYSFGNDSFGTKGVACSIFLYFVFDHFLSAGTLLGTIKYVCEHAYAYKEQSCDSVCSVGVARFPISSIKIA